MTSSAQRSLIIEPKEENILKKPEKQKILRMRVVMLMYLVSHSPPHTSNAA
jgi:hypothetical protein